MAPALVNTRAGDCLHWLMKNGEGARASAASGYVFEAPREKTLVAQPLAESVLVG